MYRSYSVNDMPQPVRFHNDNNSRANDGAIHKTETDSRAQPAEPEQRAPSGFPAGGSHPTECPSAERGSASEGTEYPCPSTGSRPAECPCGSPALCPLPRCRNTQCEQNKNKNGLLAGLKSDDLILLAVVLVLLMDGCDDKMLIAALGLVFFSDYFGF